MNIAILGAGNVGSTLGKALSDAGHSVTYGLRNPLDPKYSSLMEHAKTTTIQKAVQEHTIVLLAVPWNAAEQTIQGLDWTDKILVDCTNPITKDFSGVEVVNGLSGAERIAQWAAGAKVVKCFNQTGVENIKKPSYSAGKTVMFSAGDDEQAVKTVVQLASDIGFDAHAAGNLAFSKTLEQWAWLWIHMATKQQWGRNFSFSLLHR
jgi:8-hydroxy-5-deazaflavin:NADPH oxidoreductase